MFEITRPIELKFPMMREQYFIQWPWSHDKIAAMLIYSKFLLQKKCMKLFPVSSITRADPGFLEREFICIKVWGFALLILSHFS